MTHHKRYTYQLLLTLFAGSILPLAFAPHAYWPLALLSLTALCFFLQRAKKASHCFWYGFLYAFGAFSVGTSWVYISIHRYGQASTTTAGIITLLFTVLLASELALLTCLWGCLRKNSSYVYACWVLPAAWVLAEWCRELLFTGFPWLHIGSIASTPWLSGWIPLIGVYGMSFLLVCTCAHIAYAISKKNFFQRGAAALYMLALTLGVGYGLHNHSWTTPSKKAPLKIAMIQGNIPVSMKWDKDTMTSALDRYLSATQNNLSADIIIWPETAIPAFDVSVPAFLKNMNELMAKHNSTLITGIAHYEPSARAAYNSMLVLGQDQGRYDKVHLVPFGEYFPAPALLGWVYHAMNIPMSNDTPGLSTQTQLNAAGSIAAPAICYEVAYPTLIQERAKHANWLLAISDDAWFGRSAASAQQLQMAQIRSLETGLPMLYATNNGITAMINQHGVITKQLPVEEYATLTGTMMPQNGLTPLLHMPLNVWQWLSLLLFVLYAVYGFFRRK